MAVPYRNVKMENILRPAWWHLRQLLCQLPLMAAHSSARLPLRRTNFTTRHQFATPPLPPSQLPWQLDRSLQVSMWFCCSFAVPFSFVTSVLLWLHALCPIFYYIVWAICFLLLSYSPTLSLYFTAIMNLGQLSGARLDYFFMQQLRFRFDDLRKTFTWGTFPWYPNYALNSISYFREGVFLI